MPMSGRVIMFLHVIYISSDIINLETSSSSSKFYFQQNTTIKQKQKFMVNINKYIKALLHPAGGHQGSHRLIKLATKTKLWKLNQVVIQINVCDNAYLFTCRIWKCLKAAIIRNQILTIPRMKPYTKGTDKCYFT